MEGLKNKPGKRAHESVEIPTSAQIRHALESENIAKTVSIDGAETVVLDIDRFKAFIEARFSNGPARNMESSYRLLKNLNDTFPRGVTSLTEFQGGGFEVRPLFYYPDPEDALRTDVVKSARFHLRFRDVLNRFRMRVPLTTKDGKSSDVTVLEADSALVIFHPRFGNGYRDETDVLRVLDKKSGTYKPFSADYLSENGIHKNYLVFAEGAMTHRSNGDNRRMMRDGAAAEFPHLVSRGIIKPLNDFKQITLGNDRVNARQIERNGVSSGGSRMIQGVLHYIGKEFYGKDVRIMSLSRSLGCVVDESGNEPRITHLFKLFNRDEIEPNQKGWYLAGKKLTQTHPFNARSFGISQLAHETPLAFQERIEAVDRGIAHLMLDVAKRRPEITQIFETQSPLVLAEVGKAAYWFEKEGKKEELDALIDVYGVNGLKTFLASSIDSRAGNEVLALSQWAQESRDHKKSVEIVERIFSIFGNVVSTIDSLDVFMRDTYKTSKPEHVQSMTRATLEQARSIIGRAHATVLDSGLAGIEKLTEELESTDIALVKFLQGCQIMKKAGELDPESILGATLRLRRGSDLASDLETQGAIEHILNERYAERPESFKAEVLKHLRDAMKSPDTMFYLYYLPDTKTGRQTLVGLFRIDDIRDAGGELQGRHFASMFLDSKFEKGGLMGTIARDTLSRSSQEKPTHAECFPTDAAITYQYHEWGFVSTDMTQELGMDLLKIEWDAARNYKLDTVAEKLPKNRVIDNAEKGAVHPSERIKYYAGNDVPQFENYFAEGYVMTRYFSQQDQKTKQVRYYAAFEKPRT